MELGEKIQTLLNSQKEAIREYEEILKQINEDDSINENIKMKKELDRLKEGLDQSKEKIGKLQKENIGIKISLKEQMMKERNNLLSSSKKTIELYFKGKENGEINRLNSLENSARNRVMRLNKVATEEFEDTNKEINQAIRTIQFDINEKLVAQKEKIRESYDKSLTEIKAEYDAEVGEVSDEVMAKKQKHNNMEINIGLNWINKIAIILLLFGVATAMKYTYSMWFNDYMKGISGFVLGGIMLGVGEWLNRKEKNLFALGLCGGGIGTLYLSVFGSFFFLEILNLPISMIIAILITLGALALSQRYDSKTIAGISLFGGYLPFFSFAFIMGIGGAGVYVAMGYLMMLNLLMLVIAFKRRWVIINYLSFILNIPCLIFLVFASNSPVVGIIYGMLTFIMYLGITLAYPIREDIKIRTADLVLLGANTVINCMVVYGLFMNSGFDGYMGILALFYAVGYFLLSRIIDKKSSQEKHVQALFSITALTFTILMVPFQFGIEWAAMGWLVEALLILIFVKKRNVAKIEPGGWIILGLCIAGFLFNDLAYGWGLKHFFVRYSVLTFGLVYVLSLYVSDYKGKLFKGFKYFTLLNSLNYFRRVFVHFYTIYLAPMIPNEYVLFYQIIIQVMITIIFAYGILKINVIRDKVVVGISTALLILTSITAIFLNVNSLASPDHGVARVIAIGILLIYNGIVLITVADIVMQLIKRKGMSIEFYPLAIVIYFLGMVSLFLTNQFSLGYLNLLISIIFVIASFGCIVFGFKKNYLLIRRFGLGLSIFATAKLFIFDLSNLAGLGRMIAYFCFGLVLLGISFIYQKLSTNFKEVEENETSS